MKHCWIVSVLFIACSTERTEKGSALNGTDSMYQTYDYSGFTKQQKYSFHKQLSEGANRRQGGDLSRFYFLNFFEIEPHASLLKSEVPKMLEEAPRDDLKNYIIPTNVKAEGGRTLNEYIQHSEVDGMIIMHKGKVVFEGYPRMYPTDRHLNYSVSKIYVSTSIAILEDKGKIDTSLPIDYYFGELKGSGWEGIPIVHILAMSSGIDPVTSGKINRKASASFEPIKVLSAAKSVKPPGTVYDYMGINSTILTLLVEEISGLTYSDFVEEEIWRKIGSEHNGLITKKINGMDDFSVSSTLRDLARFGVAFTPSGRGSANPLISDDHLAKIQEVNENLKEKSSYSEELKYAGYQWDEIYEDGDFYKGGHGGQGLYISTSRDLVIAFYGTYNTEKEEHQLPLISRQLAKSGLFDLN